MTKCTVLIQHILFNFIKNISDYQIPRGKVLNEVEKGKILTFSENVASIAEIAIQISKSRKVVYNYLKNIENYGKNKRSGRKKS